MTLPNFLIIGAQKSGTTSLFEFLIQHPEVFGSCVKEPSYFFFAEEDITHHRGSRLGEAAYRTAVTRWEDYQRLFDGADDARGVGEASTLYLMSERAAERIRAALPECKLIAVLREPVTRAYSQFSWSVAKGYESEVDFRAALEREDERYREGWGVNYQYRRNSLYHRQLEPYFRNFPRSQIKVVLSDDLRSRPFATLREIFEHIGVDPDFEPDVSVDHNPSRVPRSRALARILREDGRARAALGVVLPKGLRWKLFEKARGLNLRPPPELELAHRRDLMEVFREDVEQLQTLLGRDLSDWLRV